jgi:dipeptidyl-peptidase-4
MVLFTWSKYDIHAGTISLLVLLFGFHSSSASTTSSVTVDDYARAERYSFWNLDRYVINGNIQHHWIGNKDRFWYLRTTKSDAKEFVVFDAVSRRVSPAFDQNRIAIGLSIAAKEHFDPTSLPFTVFHYKYDGKAIDFQLLAKLWTCWLKSGKCTSEPLSSYRPDESLSPDGKWAVFLQEHNLWVRPIAGGPSFPLTTDGIEHYDYARSPGDSGHAVSDRRYRLGNVPPQVIWSPDSKYILTYRLDERKVRDLYLIQSTPEDGSVRPRLYSFRNALAGDDNVATQQPVVLNVITRQQAILQTAPLDGMGQSFLESHHAWWSEDSARIFFLRMGRFSKSVSLNTAEAGSSRVQQVLQETSVTSIRTSDGWIGNAPSIRTLRSGDVIWWSERSGWGHLYYYDSTGKLRNQITDGNWVVRSIVSVDEAHRKLYFLASGREVGRDPYETHLYSINLDGTGMRLLTPEDADHDFVPFISEAYPVDGMTDSAEQDRFSPTGRYFVDSYSRPDLPPIFVVRASNGHLVKQLESADISKLQAGGYAPIEPFQVLAADGKTAIYGNLFRPSTFDASKRYPVIDSNYPGPQTTRSEKSFAMAMFDGFEAQSLAELGFIVVTIDGRGTPHRSKAFLDYSYGRLDKASDLEDHIAGIRQLAQRYPYMDLDHVGIWGVSGGGYAAAHAILAYPDFYKVAVSAEGNHNQRVGVAYWGETYIGPAGEGAYRDASNEPLAANLKGKLLLMHGEMDDDVNPAVTMNLVNALIKGNKDFDLLVIPNAHHYGAFLSPYFIRRKWDYFVRYLLRSEPPFGYELEQPQWFKTLFGVN